MTRPPVIPDQTTERREDYYCAAHRTRIVHNPDSCSLHMASPCDIRVLVPVTQREAEQRVIAAAQVVIELYDGSEGDLRDITDGAEEFEALRDAFEPIWAAATPVDTEAK